MSEGRGKGKKVNIKVPPTMREGMYHFTYLMREMIVKTEFIENRSVGWYLKSYGGAPQAS